MAFQTYSKKFTLGATVAELTTGLGANETLQISNATLTNTSAAGRTITINLASDGVAAATANLLESGKAIAASATSGCALTGMNLIPGAKLYAGADSASVVNLHISGILNAQTARTY